MIEKIVIRSINNSLKLHNRTKLSNYVAKFCTNCVQDQNLQNRKDISTKPIGNIQVKQMNNLSEIMNYMNEFNQSIDGKLGGNIKNSGNFELMCRIIRTSARNFDTYNILQTLKYLLSLNVSIESEVIMILLQLLKLRINDLTIAEIITTYYLLNYNENKTELIEALLRALKLSFINQIYSTCDKPNHKLLIRALRFACNTKCERSIELIINKLSSSKESIEIREIGAIYYGLTHVPELTKFHKYLLIKVNNVIIRYHKILTFSIVKYLLCQIYKIMEKRIADDSYFEHVINVLCESAVHRNKSFYEDIQILTQLNMIQFGNTNFITHIAKRCFEHPKILKDCLPYEMLNILKGMNICSHKTIYWNTLEPLILEYAMNEDLLFSFRASITLYLLSLDCYNKQLIEDIFTLYYCNHYKLQQKMTMFNILRIHQYVKTQHPEYQEIALGQDMIDYILEHRGKQYTLPLKSYLEEIIGNNVYIKSDIKTKLGHVIDYVIILQSDGTFLTTTDYDGTTYADTTYAEDIVVPIGCRRIFILTVPVSLTRRYSKQEQNIWRTTVASLEALTECSIVSINLLKWHKLSKTEKKSYLQKSLDDLLTLHNNAM